MFYITYKDVSKATTLEYQLGEIEGISKIIFRLDLAMQIDSFKSGVSLVFIWFLALLFIVSLLSCEHLKSPSSRRNENNVHALYRCDADLIITPFILEGMIIGLLSGTIAYFVEWYIYTYIEQIVATKIRMIEAVFLLRCFPLGSARIPFDWHHYRRDWLFDFAAPQFERISAERLKG